MTRALCSTTSTTSDDPAGRQRPHLCFQAGLGPACGVSGVAAGGRGWSERLRCIAAGAGRRDQDLHATRRSIVSPPLSQRPFPSAKPCSNQRHSTLIQPGERHWSIFTHLCESSDATGNLIAPATPGSRHSRSNTAANGSPPTRTTPGFAGFGGSARSNDTNADRAEMFSSSAEFRCAARTTRGSRRTNSGMHRSERVPHRATSCRPRTTSVARLPPTESLSGRRPPCCR